MDYPIEFVQLSISLAGGLMIPHTSCTLGNSIRQDLHHAIAIHPKLAPSQSFITRVRAVQEEVGCFMYIVGNTIQGLKRFQRAGG